MPAALAALLPRVRSDDDAQQIEHRALFDDQAAVHVQFAQREARVARQLRQGAAVGNPHRDFLGAAGAKRLAAPVGQDEVDLAAPDERPDSGVRAVVVAALVITAAVLYLFTTSIHSGALGALLTIAGSVWYPSYIGLTSSWGLTPLEDQQLGGLIMWIPAGLVYVIAGLALFAGWLREADVRAARRERARVF